MFGPGVARPVPALPSYRLLAGPRWRAPCSGPHSRSQPNGAEPSGKRTSTQRAAMPGFGGGYVKTHDRNEFGEWCSPLPNLASQVPGFQSSLWPRFYKNIGSDRIVYYPSKFRNEFSRSLGGALGRCNLLNAHPLTYILCGYGEADARSNNVVLL